MSTTIDAVRRYGGGAALALGGWAAIMVAMPFVGPAGREVAVIGSTARTIDAVIAAGGGIVEVRRGAVIARADRHDFVRALYAHGAPLVLEGRIGAGCFSPARPR